MTERHTNLLVLAPLFALASLAAHAIAYLIAEPDPTSRASLLARTGHGYLSWTPAAVGIAALVLVVAVALRVLAAARGSTSTDVHRLAFLVPVGGFAAQETLERLLYGGVSASLFTQHAFLVGVAFQVAFGLVALAVGGMLVRGAETVGRLVARQEPPRTAAAGLVWRPGFQDRPATPPVALRAAGRAPPLVAS